MTALQAAAAKLPDEDTARAFAAQVISSHQLIASDDADVQRAAAVSTAVQLFWASIAAGQVSLFAAERNSWHTPMRMAVKVVARLLALQQHCLCHTNVRVDGGGDSGDPISLEAVWQRVGQAELQLCQSGLSLLVALPAPHLLVLGLQALDTAVGEYLQVSGSSSRVDPLAGVLRAMSCLSTAAPPKREGGVGGSSAELRRVMLVEVMRVFEWGLWLLGVDAVGFCSGGCSVCQGCVAAPLRWWWSLQPGGDAVFEWGLRVPS